jgi:hypothetical protein
MPTTLFACTTLMGFAVRSCAEGWIAAEGGAESLGKSRKPSRILVLHLTVDKTPLWTWFWSITLQALVYPSCFALALIARTSTPEGTWVYGVDTRNLKGNHDDLFFLCIFLYCFFGYLTSDLPHHFKNWVALESKKIIVHHVVCMIGILCTLGTASPGAVPAALGIFAMEEGSLFFNIWSVDAALSKPPQFLSCWPQFHKDQQKRVVITWIYYVTWTLSNGVALYFLLKATLQAYQAEFSMFAFAGVFFGLPLIIVRQINMFTAKKPDLVDFRTHKL